MINTNYATVVTEPAIPDKVHEHNSTVTLTLGIIELVTGILVGLFTIAGAVLAKEAVRDNAAAAAGLAFALSLVGVIFFALPSILTGAFAIAGARTKSTCMILTTMVFAILNTIMVAPYLVYIGAALIALGQRIETVEEELRAAQDPEERVDINENALMAMGVLILLIGLIQGVVTICLSAFTCKGTCCCKRSSGSVNAPISMAPSNVAVGMVAQYTDDPKSGNQYGYDQLNA